MKTINNLFWGLGLISLGLTSCSDFDEVNTDPSKTELGSVKSYYALNQSFSKIQMDPSTGERVYVYNWGEGARFITEKKHLSIGNYDDDYISSFYYPAIAYSINNATLAVQIAESPTIEIAVLSKYEAVCSYLACIFVRTVYRLFWSLCFASGFNRWT